MLCNIHGSYSQSYSFSYSQVQMLQLDHKEGWAPNNWCFQIVVLEKTLERHLDSKEIKPVNPEYLSEGLRPKLKFQYFGHLMWRTDSLEKTLMLGNTEGERRGRLRMRWLDRITNPMVMNLSTLQEIVEGRGLWHAAVRGLQSRTWLSSWTTATTNINVVASLALLLVPLPYKADLAQRGWLWLSYTSRPWFLPFPVFFLCVSHRSFKSLLRHQHLIVSAQAGSVASPLLLPSKNLCLLPSQNLVIVYLKCAMIHPSTDEWISKVWHICIQWDIYYSVLRMNEVYHGWISKTLC